MTMKLTFSDCDYALVYFWPSLCWDRPDRALSFSWLVWTVELIW